MLERFAERNKEIAQRVANGETLQAIADSFNLTRERVRQIALKQDVRSTVHHIAEMNKIEKKAVSAQKQKIKDEKKRVLHDAVDIVRSGISAVEAAKLTKVTLYRLLKALKTEGVQSQHGRFRDFSTRHARVKELLAQGCSINGLIRILRQEGDITMNSIWFNNHYGLRYRQNTATIQDVVKHVYNNISSRSKYIIERWYGIDGENPETIEQIAKDVGISSFRAAKILVNTVDLFRKPGRIEILQASVARKQLPDDPQSRLIDDALHSSPGQILRRERSKTLASLAKRR